MFQLTMQTCALLLGLVMLAGAREGRPFPTHAPPPPECCEFLREYIRDFVNQQVGKMTGELLEAMQWQEQQAERRAQEASSRSATALRDALQLQEAKTATALQGVVRQMEQLLRDRDEAALRRTLDERLQRIEEGARALGKPSTPSPEREDAAAAGGLASLQQLERRVLGLEASCSRLQPQLSTPQAPTATSPPSISSSSPSTPPSSSPSSPPSTTPSPSTSPSIPSSPSPSSPSTNSSIATTISASSSPSAPIARDQQTERKRVQERMKETRARMERAEAQPSPLGEALWNAAFDGSLEEVQRLLDEGADVNYTSSYGSSPLRAAAFSSSPSTPEVASLLLSRGADVNAVDADGWSALHWAARVGNAPVVRLLLGAGAEVDAREVDGATSLHLAARYNNNEAAVRALLAGGARRELKCWSGDWKDKTPFDLAESDAIRNLLRP